MIFLAFLAFAMLVLAWLVAPNGDEPVVATTSTPAGAPLTEPTAAG